MASLPAMAVPILSEDAGRGGSELAFLDFEGMAAILADSHRRVNGLRFVRPLRFFPYEVRHAKRRDRGHASCHIVHMAPETNSFFACRLTLLDHLYLNIVTTALGAFHPILLSFA